jgi:hydroxymethylpyrimidine/phosphomethylpyrimidine kinase
MPPIALSIAGSDSGGGAGIQADLATFQSFGVFGTTALTAVTAQNTLGVSGVHVVPASMVRQQIAAVAADLRPAACKSGMLATAEIVALVAASLEEFDLRPYVLDPVMVATSGDRLLDESARDGVLRRLVPLSTVVTPNLDEAELLLGRKVRDEDGMAAAAEELVAFGAGAALVKGGHLSGDIVVDILYDGSRHHRWERPRIETRNTHGTGCTLSAAITAGLAHGRPLDAAVADALEFVALAMVSAPGLGRGHGPLNLGIRPAAPIPGAP